MCCFVSTGWSKGACACTTDRLDREGLAARVALVQAPPQQFVMRSWRGALVQAPPQHSCCHEKLERSLGMTLLASDTSLCELHIRYSS